jgi:hypothetical protein
MNGTEVGKYTAEEFAAGVNIAELANNPNQVVSKELFNATLEKYKFESGLRSTYMVEHSIRSHTKYKPEGEYDYDNMTADEWIALAKAIKEGQKADPKVSQADKDDKHLPIYGLVGYYTSSKLDHQNRINGTIAAINKLRTFKPVECTVTISK